jgi:hypothetical protein
VWKDERLVDVRAARDPRPALAPRVKAPDGGVQHADQRWHLQGARRRRRAREQLAAHGQLAGMGAHWELWMLAQGGLTPLQALRAATSDGARYIGLQQDLGSLEAGKLADFLVLDANPLDDIRNSTSIRNTVLNGRVYDAHTMARIDETGTGPRPTFFWSELQDALPARLEDAACAGCGAQR